MFLPKRRGEQLFIYLRAMHYSASCPFLNTYSALDILRPVLLYSVVQMPPKRKGSARASARPSTSPYARQAGHGQPRTGPEPVSPPNRAQPPAEAPAWVAALLDSMDKRVEAVIDARLGAQPAPPTPQPTVVASPLNTGEASRMPAPAADNPLTVPLPTPGPSAETAAATAAATAINNVTCSITGKDSDGVVNNPGFISAGRPIGSLVPQKVKQKIWAGEFVELHHLLSTSEPSESFRLEMGMGEAAGPSLHIVPKRKSPQLSLSQWIRAWNRYMSVVCQATPHHSVPLMQHMETVLSIAEQKGRWWIYDTEFRRMVATQEIAWGSAHLELFLSAMLQGQGAGTVGTPATTHAGKRVPPPKGTCFQFHTTGVCSRGLNCAFQHKCYGCLALHPYSTCRRNPPPTPKVLERFTQGQPFLRGASAPNTNANPSGTFRGKQIGFHARQGK